MFAINDVDIDGTVFYTVYLFHESGAWIAPIWNELKFASCVDCRLLAPDVDCWYQMCRQMHRCRLTIMLNFFFLKYMSKLGLYVVFICCIYPNMNKNYFISHHMKNRSSPYNCTQSYNTFCVAILQKIAVKEGVILCLDKYCILFTVLYFRKPHSMDTVLLHRYI